MGKTFGQAQSKPSFTHVTGCPALGHELGPNGAESKDTLNPPRDTLYAIRYTNLLSRTTHQKMYPLWGTFNSHT
ncbi:MAG: hypothetical protein ACYTFW_08005, partial [Planctomycetota bacterium]